MNQTLKEIEESYLSISKRVKMKPGIGIILGTGLGNLVDKVSIRESLPYEDIPHFPVSTVEGHASRLLFGLLAGKKAVIMQGRVHYYEGYSLDRITFPVRVMKRMGIEILIISNAAGGLDSRFSPGDVMVISDHINLTGQNPLIGPNFDSFGLRFPDMTEAYDRKLIRLAEEAAVEKKIKLQKGVYAGVTGPSLETPAERQLLAFDRGRCRWDVHHPGSDRGGPLRPSHPGLFGHFECQSTGVHGDRHSGENPGQRRPGREEDDPGRGRGMSKNLN